MKRPSTSVLFGVTVAVAVGGFLYWFVGDPYLAGATGLCWGGWVAMLQWIRCAYPDALTGDGWHDGRWTGLGVALTTTAALVGVSPSLPVSSDLRLALGALVLGAGSAGYMAATLAELERADGGRGTAKSGSGGARVETTGD